MSWYRLAPVEIIKSTNPFSISEMMGPDIPIGVIAPAKVKEINRVYQPDGSETQRVKISIQDQEKLRMKPEEIKKIITALTNSNVELVFD